MTQKPRTTQPNWQLEQVYQEIDELKERTRITSLAFNTLEERVSSLEESLEVLRNTLGFHQAAIYSLNQPPEPAQGTSRDQRRSEFQKELQARGYNPVLIQELGDLYK